MSFINTSETNIVPNLIYQISLSLLFTDILWSEGIPLLLKNIFAELQYNIGNSNVLKSYMKHIFKKNVNVALLF